jgi:hypothetical protein
LILFTERPQSLQGRHLPDPSGHSFFVRDHDSVCPFFLTERFPLPQESQQGLLIGECRVQLWQRYDSPIAISRLHEQTVREPLAPHRFAKGDISSIRLISAGESECPQDGQTVFTAARTFSGSILFLCIGALQTFRLLVVY